MPRKATNKPKSKEQILSDLKANQDFQKKMRFVREDFWPALCKATTSIDDASILLAGFNTTIMQEFLGYMREKKLADLKLVDKLDPDAEKHEEMLDLLTLFEKMTVFDAKDYIEGMRNEIALFQQEEMKSRPLNSLKTKWVDEL